MFDVAIQAAIGSSIIAKENNKALRKIFLLNVTAVMSHVKKVNKNKNKEKKIKRWAQSKLRKRHF